MMKVLSNALLAGVFLVVAAPAAAQTRLEMETVEASDPRTKLIEGLVRPLLAGDSAGAAAYVLRNADPTADPDRLIAQMGVLLNALRELRAPELGEFMVSVGGTQAVAVQLSDASGAGLNAIITTAGEPARILTIGRGMAPPRPPEERFDDFASLHASLLERAGNDRFSGVVLAARAGEVVFHEAYGLADRERQIPVRTDTRFNLGSGDKQFTGLAILRLVQAGQLDLDAPVGRYVTGLSPAVAETVTLRHLLQHRSGLGDYMRHAAFDQDRTRYRTTAELMSLVQDEELAFDPGSQRRYSNSGYVVLGAVLEAVTGQSYADVVRDLVFTPAGMTQTGPGGPADQPNTAVGYGSNPPGPGGVISSNETFRPAYSSAGGGYSTTDDLMRLVQALRQNRLLDSEHTALFVSGYDATPSPDGPRTFQLGGGLGGINTSLMADLDSGDVVMVLANRSPPIAEILTRAMRRDLLPPR